MLCCFGSAQGGQDDFADGPVKVTTKSRKNRKFGLSHLAPNSCGQPLSFSSMERNERPVHVIFVHGLGGSEKETWIHRGSKEFWPLWLCNEAGFENVSLYTFGYDACREKIWAPRNALGIQGFARQLLHCLHLHYSDVGEVFCISRLVLKGRFPQSS